MSKRKRDSPLISYLVGDGQTIYQIAHQLSNTLEAYNTNFRKISHHNIQIDKNLNTLAKLGENLTQYERFNLQLATGLQRLKTILKESDIGSLLNMLSNALLEIIIPCVIGL